VGLLGGGFFLGEACSISFFLKGFSFSGQWVFYERISPFWAKSEGLCFLEGVPFFGGGLGVLPLWELLGLSLGGFSFLF